MCGKTGSLSWFFYYVNIAFFPAFCYKQDRRRIFMENEYVPKLPCSVCKAAVVGGLCPQCRVAQDEDMLFQIQEHTMRDPEGLPPIHIIKWLEARKFSGEHEFERKLQQIKDHVVLPEATMLPMEIISWLWTKRFTTLRDYLIDGSNQLKMDLVSAAA